MIRRSGYARELDSLKCEKVFALLGMIFAKAGCRRVKPNSNSNRTWRHVDGSEARVHEHGNTKPSG